MRVVAVVGGGLREVFESLGVRVVELQDGGELPRVLDKLLAEEKPHIVLIEERLASEASEALKDFKLRNPLPVLVTIP